MFNIQILCIISQVWGKL